MAIFTILYGNYYPPHGQFKLNVYREIRRTNLSEFHLKIWENHQRCQQNKFTMLYVNYCYIIIENFPRRFSPCRISV